MCGIVAAVGQVKKHQLAQALALNMSRGRDGFGIYVNGKIWRTPGEQCDVDAALAHFEESTYIGNCDIVLANNRAEPTTELVPVASDHDQQPYRVGGWTVVHNGTIANDKQLIGQFDLFSPTRIDSWVIAALLHEHAPNGLLAGFAQVIKMLQGSYAILAYHEGTKGVIHYATNYRPLYAHEIDGSTIVSSVKMLAMYNPRLIQPYSYGIVSAHGVSRIGNLIPLKITRREKTLVVMSGGLDSTTVAAMLKAQDYDIELLHFDYSCRATGPERIAVEAIARELDVPLRIIETDIFKTIGNSRLLDKSVNSINNGEAGAEQAHEWVPARNMILSSIAMGIAEANGFDNIALGINLEESGGGYTDNVLDLYEGLNGLMQWIVGVGKKLKFISPVGHLMKHEIVKEGLKVNAPYASSWSCYNAHELNGVYTHCGECGPCTMRRRAFRRNGVTDPVKFICDEVA